MAEIGETPLTMILRQNGLLPPLTRREIQWRWTKAWFDGYHYRMMKYGFFARWEKWWQPEYSRWVWLKWRITGSTGRMIRFRHKWIAHNPKKDKTGTVSTMMTTNRYRSTSCRLRGE